MFRQTQLAIGLVCFLLPTVAYAQGPRSGVPYAKPESVPGSPAVLSYGYSSTLQEGILRGEADWMRGYGEGHRSLGEAACYAQTARAQALQNSQASFELYWHKKQLYREYRESLSGRATKTTSQEAGYRRTKRPSVSPFAKNGQIMWPGAVKRKESGKAQDELQAVFAAKAAGRDTTVGTSDYRKAKAAIAKIHDDLKKNVRSLPCDEYSAALGLLRTLEQEINRRPEPILLTQK